MKPLYLKEVEGASRVRKGNPALAGQGLGALPWVEGGITLAGGWKAVQGEVRKLDRRLAALTLTQVLLATDINEEESKEAE